MADSVRGLVEEWRRVAAVEEKRAEGIRADLDKVGWTDTGPGADLARAAGVNSSALAMAFRACAKELEAALERERDVEPPPAPAPKPDTTGERPELWRVVHTGRPGGVRQVIATLVGDAP